MIKPSYNPLSSEENDEFSTEDSHSPTISTDDCDNSQKGLHEAPKTCINITIGWIAMILAILSGAAIGPVFKYMEEQNISPVLAAAWYIQ